MPKATHRKIYKAKQPKQPKQLNTCGTQTVVTYASFYQLDLENSYVYNKVMAEIDNENKKQSLLSRLINFIRRNN